MGRSLNNVKVLTGLVGRSQMMTASKSALQQTGGGWVGGNNLLIVVVERHIEHKRMSWFRISVSFHLRDSGEGCQ